MRRLTVAMLGGLLTVLLSGSPAHALFRHHHAAYTPVVGGVPASPFGFQQVLQGVQLLHLLVGDQRQGGGGGQQQPAARCVVSGDVVQSLNNTDKTLESATNSLNTLTDPAAKFRFRDPKFEKDVNKPIEKPKTGAGSGGSGDGGHLTPPGAH
jgi:hypothetical protein